MKAKTFNQIPKGPRAKTFNQIMKFNPYHDRLGRFTSGSGYMASGYTGDKDRQAVTFSANPKTKEGRMAIERQDGVTAAAFGMARFNYSETDVPDFTQSVVDAKATVPENSRWRVTAYSEEEFKDWHSTATCYKTEYGSTFAIDNGDIISVCSAKSDYVSGKQLLQKAVEKGGTKLDSYDGNDIFYKKCGFEPVSWCKWDDAYAPGDWIAANGYTQESWDAMVKSGKTVSNSELKVARKEDIVFYKYTGKQSTESLGAFKNRVTASADYDTAYETRDKSITGKES